MYGIENLTPYSEWPKWVKVTTATNTSSLTVKESKIARFLSGFNIGVGFSVLFLPTFFNNMFENMPPPSYTLDLITMMIGFLSIMIGIFYFQFTIKAIVWVKEYSSWEERFTHRSSTEHKLIVFSILAGMMLVSYLLARLILNMVYG